VKGWLRCRLGVVRQGVGERGGGQEGEIRHCVKRSNSSQVVGLPAKVQEQVPHLHTGGERLGGGGGGADENWWVGCYVAITRRGAGYVCTLQRSELN